MKVAIIKSRYTSYGGAEKYTLRLIKAFAEKNIVINLLTGENLFQHEFLNNVHFIKLKQFRYNRLLKLITFNNSVNKHLKNRKYDCIFGMDRTEKQTHLRAGGGCHISWINRRSDESSMPRRLSFKINPFHRKMIEIERLAFLSKDLKRVFCNSNLVKNEIIYYYPQVAEKIMVVHNGVEWHEYAEAFDYGLSGREEILKRLKLAPNRFYFLFVGSGFERKGLIKAILAMHDLPQYTELIVVGKDKNENRYRAKAKKNGLEKRVHFFGPQSKITPFLQFSDAFILPTIYDPFSNASLEALAMGLYTITSNANGCAEVIKDGAGFIIKDLKNIDSVTTAMNTALCEHLTKKEIRDSVSYLDFNNQLDKIVNVCLADVGYKN